MKRLELEYPSDPAVVHDARRRVGDFARTVFLTDEGIEELQVAVSEACANAICHGSPHGRKDHFRVSCWLGDDELVVEVVDTGRGFALPGPAVLPERFSACGRGVFLMERLCDRLEVEKREPGTAVRITKRVRTSRGTADPNHQASARPSRRGSLPPRRARVRASR
jgi:anti-sigma regulatory factor (Ser/Thr protein kinase)